jgi:[ribosomal protein S5]-alanine N-acetyltransferase
MTSRSFHPETQRLCLRPIAPDDIDSLHQLWTDPEVRRFLWDDETIPREQVAEIVEASRQLFEHHGFGLWGVFSRSDNQLIGFCGFWHFHTPPELELIYGIAPDRWRQGLATEAAQAIIQYGFTELGFDRISASTDAANESSIRVMQKLGMHLSRRSPSSESNLVFYSRVKQEVK